MSLVVGTILKVKPGYGDPSQNPSTFTIRTVQGYEIVITCPFFCPAHKDDSLFGVIMNDPETGGYSFIQSPAVQLPADRERITQAFGIGLQGLSVKRGTLDQLYEFFRVRTLDRLHITPQLFKQGQQLEDLIVENIIEYMDLPEPAVGLSNILDQKTAEKLVIWWKSNYTLRRLYLLGLTKREIQDSCERGWEPTSLYCQLLINPMVVETVPYDKAVNIGLMRLLQLGEKDRQCGKIVRHVDKECGDRKWSCYPMFALNKEFPDLFDLQQYLKTVFQCEIKYNFLYIRHQAETENTLTECLANAHRNQSAVLHIPVSQEDDIESDSDGEDDDDLPPEEIEALMGLNPKGQKSMIEIMPSVKNQLSKRQGEAISMVLTNSVSVITGPAGTGKTTVISQLAEELELRNIPYLICTPTGKASARLKEVVRRTDRVMTLHMFLSRYNHIQNPIGVFIVDEASMVDNCLAARVVRRLWCGMSPGTIKNFQITIVLVGDKNQLQPINAGDFFNQLILSDKIPRVMLTQDRRRETKGVLYANMRRLARYHDKPEKRTIKWGEDTHHFTGSFEQVYDLFDASRQQTGIDSVTVICPYNDECRIINQKLQDILIPHQPGLHGLQITDSFGSIWRVGARVMMLENRYDISVMNGEQGIITKINNSEPGVWVLFHGRDEPVFIPCYKGITLKEGVAGNWNDRLEEPLSTKYIALSWCLTVDKSQGSQWDVVIFFIPNRQKSSGFVNWKRIYTGISRARKMLYIITENQDKIYDALLTDPPRRFDNLARRLNGDPVINQYVNRR